MEFKEVVEIVGLIVDGAGVAVIFIGLIAATFRYISKRGDQEDRYKRFRQDLGRGILLGLELLVAADIIRTVAVSPTMENALVLGLIVLIRTFLSMSIQIELEGRLPWRAGTSS